MFSVSLSYNLGDKKYNRLFCRLKYRFSAEMQAEDERVPDFRGKNRFFAKGGLA